MSDPLPRRPPIDHTPRARAVADLAAEDTPAVLEALGTETARAILQALEEPATTSEVAEVVGTSIQNAGYHLDKLREAGLVTEVGTWYSAKGRPMTVYAPTSERVEFRFGGGPDEEPGGTA